MQLAKLNEPRRADGQTAGSRNVIVDTLQTAESFSWFLKLFFPGLLLNTKYINTQFKTGYLAYCI